MGLPYVLSFVSGQSLHSPSCFNVTIIDDANLEEKENFTIVLSTEFPGVTLSRAQSTVEIIDNDGKEKSKLFPLDIIESQVLLIRSFLQVRECMGNSFEAKDALL